MELSIITWQSGSLFKKNVTNVLHFWDAACRGSFVGWAYGPPQNHKGEQKLNVDDSIGCQKKKNYKKYISRPHWAPTVNRRRGLNYLISPYPPRVCGYVKNDVLYSRLVSTFNINNTRLLEEKLGKKKRQRRKRNGL